MAQGIQLSAVANLQTACDKPTNGGFGGMVVLQTIENCVQRPIEPLCRKLNGCEAVTPLLRTTRICCQLLMRVSDVVAWQYKQT